MHKLARVTIPTIPRLFVILANVWLIIDTDGTSYELGITSQGAICALGFVAAQVEFSTKACFKVNVARHAFVLAGDRGGCFWIGADLQLLFLDGPVVGLIMWGWCRVCANMHPCTRYKQRTVRRGPVLCLHRDVVLLPDLCAAVDYGKPQNESFQPCLLVLL